MVNKFYAVTATGVYRCSAERDRRGVPIIELVANRDCDSEQALGSRLGQFNEPRRTIGICEYGIYLYDPIERSPVERTNGHLIGDHTQGIAALFLVCDEAMACLRSRGNYGGRSLDGNYATATYATLEAIGDCHPVFVPSLQLAIRIGRLTQLAR